MELRRQPCIRAARNDHNPLQLYFKILPNLLCHLASSRCDAHVRSELVSKTMPKVACPQPAQEHADAGADDRAVTTDQDKAEKDPAEKGPVAKDEATLDKATQD